MLPIPGVTVTHEIQIMLSSMPPNFLEWWKEVGGNCLISDNRRGMRYESTESPIIWFNTGRKSHKLAGGQACIIRFNKEDANMAVMLLLMFDELVDSHNMVGLIENEY